MQNHKTKKKKAKKRVRRDEQRPEYDLSKLGPGVRGKYFERYKAGPIIIQLVPDNPKKS